MTTTVSQEAVEVTQADRDAVAEFHRQSFKTLFTTTDADIDAGINRSYELLCQAFARHRQQAERDALARMEPVGWRPIETAPKDGTRFWGFWPVDDEVGQQQVTYFDQFTLPFPRFCDLADHIDWTQPTAWQPLPTPPAGAA